MVVVKAEGIKKTTVETVETVEGVRLELPLGLAQRLLALLINSPGYGCNENLDTIRSALFWAGINPVNGYEFEIKQKATA